MKPLQAVFFWFGGVLVQPLPDLLLQEIFGQPIESVKPQTRLDLRALAQDLAIGRIDSRGYCQEAIRICQSDLREEDLATGVIRDCVLQASILEAIDRLPVRYERWLIVDYPQDWFYPIDDRMSLLTRFPDEYILFTSNCGLTRFVPDIFYQIIQRSNLPMEECMIVDGVTARAIEAVRHGLSSTIFVDARRLERDFELRKLIP
jgi:hypothetical protein